MTAFRDAVGNLAARTEREVVALYGRYQRGDIDRGRFVALAAAVLARARTKGVSLADLAFTAEVIKALRRRTAPLGLTPPEGDTERLQQSVATLLDQDIDYASTPEELRGSQAARLSRLARDSAVEAAVFGFAQAARETGFSSGWTRETDLNPCPVCTNLADGVQRSWSVTMKRHTGCACVPRAAFI